MSSPTPIINSVTPSSGPAAGGTTVTIFGQNFVFGCKVKFNGIDSPLVTFVSSNQLTAVTPQNDIGPATVRVVNPGQVVGILQNGFLYTNAPPPPAPLVPIINSVTPSSGPLAGGTQVTITGQNFVFGCQAKFGGEPAQTTSFVSSSQLNVVTPQGLTAGPATVRVLNPNQPQAGILQNGFTYVTAPPPPPQPSPVITSVNPSSGPTGGGTTVMITGQNFVLGCQAKFGGTPAQTTNFINSSQVSAVTPSTPTAGPVTVRVVNPNPNQQPAVAPNAFTYVAAPPPPTPQPPFITSVQPPSGPTSGNTPVTIFGQNFAQGCQVKFGGTPATITSFNGNALGVLTPSAQTFGPVTVRVINPDQQTAIAQNAFNYTQAPPPPPPQPSPFIAAVNPLTGPIAGGTTVTIDGQSFAQGCQVRFGNNGATVTSNTPTRLIVLTPSSPTAGPMTVRVINPNQQTAIAPNPFTYVAAPPPPPPSPSPFITAINPLSGPLAGGTQVTVVGQNFVFGCKVKFGETEAATTFVASNQVRATTPPRPSPGVVNVILTNPDGKFSNSPQPFQYTGAPPPPPPPPTPTGLQVTPAGAPVGTDVSVRGNFTGVAEVRFNGRLSLDLTLEPPPPSPPGAPPPTVNTVTAEVPADATDGPVTLVTSAGVVLTSANAFDVQPARADAPVINDNICGTPGRDVKIKGLNFVSGKTIVFFTGPNMQRLKGEDVRVTDSTTLCVKVPAAAVTGEYSVKVKGVGRSQPKIFTVEPATLTLRIVEPEHDPARPARIARGRVSRVAVQGDENLPEGLGDYAVVDEAKNPVPNVFIRMVTRRPTFGQFGLPAPNDLLFAEAYAGLGLARANDPRTVELLIEVKGGEDGPTPGVYQLRAKVCTKEALAPLEIVMKNQINITFPLPTFVSCLAQNSPPTLSEDLPDPSIAALLGFDLNGIKGLLDLLVPPMPAAPAAPPAIAPAVVEPNTINVTALRPVSRTSVCRVLPGPRTQVNAPARPLEDNDGDCLPDSFEQELARAFVPAYNISRGEKDGTGFAKFRPNENRRVTDLTTLTPATQPIVYFRVKPLGFSRVPGVLGERRFAVLQLDYFTMWTRDDGLATIPQRLRDVLMALLMRMQLDGHDLEEERSALLVAAELGRDAPNSFPLDVNLYKAYELFVTAHEGVSQVDQTAYLRLDPLVDAGQHVQLFLALSKHGSYESNPDFFPILRGIEAAARVALPLIVNNSDAKKGSAIVALYILVFFIILVERFKGGNPPVLPEPLNNLINVGDLPPGRQLGGARWIQEPTLAGGRDLITKFRDPLWQLTLSVPVTNITLEFEPEFGAPGTPVSIFSQEDISGTRFVQFCDAAAVPTVVTPNLLRVLVPEGAGTGPVRLSGGGGATRRSTKTFAVCPGGQPRVERFAPAEGPQGEQVEIVGENLAGATSVRFSGVDAPFVVNSSTSITAYVPIQLAPQTEQNVPINVTTPNGTSPNSRANFKVLGASSPQNYRVTGFHPPLAPTGTELLIFGANLGGVTSVQFGSPSATATPSFVSGTALRVVVPGNARNGPLTVRGNLGEATPQGDLVVNPAPEVPVIERFSPTSGPVLQNGGTVLRISGLNLNNVSRVLFGGTTGGPSVSVPANNPPFRITVPIPPQAATNVALDFPLVLMPLRGNSGPIVSARNFINTDIPAGPRPSITDFSPRGATVGSVVTISGNNLVGATLVRFNGVDACFKLGTSPNSNVPVILATVPADNASGSITVTTPDGNAPSPFLFNVTGAPPKAVEVKTTKETKETKESKESKEGKDTKEGKEGKEGKETKEGKEGKEKESKETKEGKEGKEKEGKERKEGKEVKERNEGKNIKDAFEGGNIGGGGLSGISRPLGGGVSAPGTPDESEARGRSFISPEERPAVGQRALGRTARQQDDEEERN